VNDIADGTRIFVVMQSNMTLETAKEILAAVHLHGRPTLIYATDGGQLSVTKEGDHLLHATIPKFADEADVTETLCASDWLAVCEQARAIAI
jgi:hypothetical protein